MSTEMITFTIGILSVLPVLSEKLIHIPDHLFLTLSDRTKRVFATLVFVGIIVSPITQTIQYVYAVTATDQKNKIEQEKRKVEKEYAQVLYYLAENKLDLTTQFLRDKPYVIGYQAFRNKKFNDAKGYFHQSISKSEFVAESRYLLGYISLLENEKTDGADLSYAIKEADSAIEQDRDYAAPYYLRAILKVKGDQIENGLDDLQSAVTLDKTTCYDIQQPDEINRWWQRIAQHARFLSIQTDCRTKWGISQNAAS